MTFQLDTSGFVVLPDNGQTTPAYWHDLDAATQIAVEQRLRAVYADGTRRPDGSAIGFSDLSTDMLIAIIAEVAQ